MSTLKKSHALFVLMYILWCIVYSFILGSDGYNIVKSILQILLISILIIDIIFEDILPDIVSEKMILGICFALVLLSIIFAVQSSKEESKKLSKKEYSGIIKWYNYIIIILLNYKIISSLRGGEVFKPPYNAYLILTSIIVQIIFRGTLL